MAASLLASRLRRTWAWFGYPLRLPGRQTAISLSLAWLDEVDDLITASFTASGINPRAIGTHYAHAELRGWYERYNQHVMRDRIG